MKRSFLAALLCFSAGAARAEDHDEVLVDEQPSGEVRQVEVIKIAGHSKKPPRAELDEHDDEGPGRGRGHEKHMKRMLLPKGRFGGPDADPAMKERFLKVRAAEDKVREVKIKLSKAKDSEKAALKGEAKAALGELFDARLAMDQAALDRMQEKIEERKAKLEKKKAARERLVEERADRLAGDAPDWDD